MTHSRKLVNVTRIPIRWGDLDAYGHVNNTVYFRYLEQGRVEWIEAMGIPVRPGEAGPVIINASCTFLVPLNYPGTVEVRTHIGKIGNSSVETFADIMLEGSDTVYAEGAAKVVWMDMTSGKSVPIPDAVRAQLEAE